MTTTDSHATAESPRIVPPVVLDAKDGLLLFFKTAAHAEAYVEAVDVANEEYGPCWDSEGRLLMLSIESRHASVLGVLPYQQQVVRVLATEPIPSHVADLHLALLRHVERLGLQRQMPVTNDTADILEFAVGQSGWS